jgi:hypothetical protein
MDQPCTLDGLPARVVGRLNQFAMVRQLVEPYHEGEWSWSTVEHVLNKGGAFKL